MKLSDQVCQFAGLKPVTILQIFVLLPLFLVLQELSCGLII